MADKEKEVLEEELEDMEENGEEEKGEQTVEAGGEDGGQEEADSHRTGKEHIYGRDDQPGTVSAKFLSAGAKPPDQPPYNINLNQHVQRRQYNCQHNDHYSSFCLYSYNPTADNP